MKGDGCWMLEWGGASMAVIYVWLLKLVLAFGLEEMRWRWHKYIYVTGLAVLCRTNTRKGNKQSTCPVLGDQVVCVCDI